MPIDYSKLTEITVTNQAELDAVPDDFKGSIYISCTAAVAVSKRYYRSVVARGNSSVVARGNSSVAAYKNSSVEARENSSVAARENSSVEAYENSSVAAYGNSSVAAYENSSVAAYGNSFVVARGNSSVAAYENSSVVARENSSVAAGGNSQIVNRQINGKIQISGNARQVFMPKNIREFMDFYGIEHTEKTAVFYKAVHRDEKGYFSDHDHSFRYEIGGIVTEDCDTDTAKECSRGIHVAHLDWALHFGSNWDDLAILEVETDISDIVMPVDTDGKVRTSKIKVIREVPLEECGVYGRILAKRRTSNYD